MDIKSTDSFERFANVKFDKIAYLTGVLESPQTNTKQHCLKYLYYLAAKYLQNLNHSIPPHHHSKLH